MKRVVADQFVGVWDCVPNKLCRSIIKDHQSSPFRGAGRSGYRYNPANKKSIDISVGEENLCDAHIETLSVIKQCLDDYGSIWPDSMDVERFAIVERFNVQQYLPNGGYYARHSERQGPRSSHRHLVFMVYLNTVTDGGGTAFPNQDLVVDAVAGRVVIWPSDWTHSHYGIVSPTQEKFIMTGWYSYV